MVEVVVLCRGQDRPTAWENPGRNLGVPGRNTGPGAAALQQPPRVSDPQRIGIDVDDPRKRIGAVPIARVVRVIRGAGPVRARLLSHVLAQWRRCCLVHSVYLVKILWYVGADEQPSRAGTGQCERGNQRARFSGSGANRRIGGVARSARARQLTS